MGGPSFKTTVDDRAWKQLRKRLPGIAKVKIRVGLVGSEAEQTNGESNLTNAELGMIHEFGAPAAGIPARSFIRRTYDDKIDELKGMQLKLSKMLLDDKLDVARAFAILGEWGANAIKATIVQGKVEPGLKPQTIARKGSSKPLVDTAQLVNSISWVIHK